MLKYIFADVWRWSPRGRYYLKNDFVRICSALWYLKVPIEKPKKSKRKKMQKDKTNSVRKLWGPIYTTHTNKQTPSYNCLF